MENLGELDADEVIEEASTEDTPEVILIIKDLNWICRLKRVAIYQKLLSFFRNY